MKHRYGLLFLTAAAGGAFLSLMYINPYNGVITLSEAILQLSGSRGTFALGFSYSELAAFAMRLFPEFMIELYAGIMLYRHFCTASIYVFSRYPHRVKWYLGEAGRLWGTVCMFNVLLLTAAILTTAIRYELLADSAGILLLTYHFFIHSLWIYVMTLSVNLLAVYFGSSTAYAWVISVQLVCIVLLNLMDLLVRYCDNGLTYGNTVIWNPIAHLVLGWHGSNMESMNQAFTSSDIRMDLNGSLILFFLLGIILTSAGALVTKKHDLLVSDLEAEG